MGTYCPYTLIITLVSDLVNLTGRGLFYKKFARGAEKGMVAAWSYRGEGGAYTRGEDKRKNKIIN